MAAPNKDIIYVDIDDEITGIIDKLRGSENKIVALVLPKRATMLQSIVNMKLLKRAADDAKKHLVLITSEAGLMPLAGAANVLVAKTLNSKPEIPVPPQPDDGREEMVNEDDSEPEFTADNAGDRPVGELAGFGPALPADGVETVELDDIEDLPEEPTNAKDFGTAKPKKDKKLAVPNFERFRMLLALGAVLLILLIIGAIYAATVLPKAVIAITTDASNYNVSLNVTADTKRQTLDAANHILPAKQAQQQKTYTEQAAATGTQNNGEKATGQVTVSEPCTKKPDTISAGFGLTSNGLTFIATDDLKFTNFNTDSNGNFVCSGTVPVRAQQGGSQYNLASGSKFSVSGYSGATGTNSDDFTGGTDNIVKVVSQSDIDNAKSKISASDATMKQTLKDQLSGDGWYPIAESYSAGTPNVTTTAQVGDVADSVSVTETVTYTMVGVKQDDLKTIIDNDVKTQIDTSKQKILNEGLDKATFNVTNLGATSSQFTLSTVATAGPELNVDELKQQAAGKKPGDFKQLLKSNPDVTNVDVKLSPFFVSSIPKKTDKITITIAKPKAAPAANRNANNP